MSVVIVDVSATSFPLFLLVDSLAFFIDDSKRVLRITVNVQRNVITVWVSTRDLEEVNLLARCIMTILYSLCYGGKVGRWHLSGPRSGTQKRDRGALSVKIADTIHVSQCEWERMDDRICTNQGKP